MKTLLISSVVGLLALGCATTPEPKTADAAFKQVCRAALVLEGLKKGTQLPEQVLTVCADEHMPGRILAVVAEANAEVKKLEEELKKQPAPAVTP